MASSRLNFQKIQRDDASVFHEVLANHEHMQYTIKANNLSDSERYFAMLASNWEKYGYGAWRVDEKETEKPIGWGGIIVDEEDPGNWGPELVYFFHPDATGKGYATELGRHAIQFVFNEAKLKKVAAFAKPENTASVKVLEKLGFQQIRYIEAMGRYYFEVIPQDQNFGSR